MFISDSIVLQINILAVIVLLTIVGSLLLRRKNVKANIFLSILVFYPVSTIVLNIVALFMRKPELLFLNSINAGINFTFGPVLLVYLSLIQGKDIKRLIPNFWHFVPSFLSFLSALYYIFIPDSEKIVVMDKMHTGSEPIMNSIAIMSLIHFGYYLYIAWKKVNLYQEKAFDLGMDEMETAVKWQREFLICLISLNLLLIAAFVLPMLILGKAHIYSDMIAVPILSLLMYGFMIYKGLSYHVIFNKPAYAAFTREVAPLNRFIEEMTKLENMPTACKAEIDQEITLKPRLENLFQIEKIHMQAGLKLYDVAERLSVRPVVLSAFINTHLKLSFFDLVNNFRVEEAKKMLIHVDFQHYKTEYVGEKSGFNSRASFFRVFKKHVGKTPQDFKDEYFLRRQRDSNTRSDLVYP